MNDLIASRGVSEQKVEVSGVTSRFRCRIHGHDTLGEGAERDARDHNCQTIVCRAVLAWFQFFTAGATGFAPADEQPNNATSGLDRRRRCAWPGQAVHTRVGRCRRDPLNHLAVARVPDGLGGSGASAVLQVLQPIIQGLAFGFAARAHVHQHHNGRYPSHCCAQ